MDRFRSGSIARRSSRNGRGVSAPRQRDGGFCAAVLDALPVQEVRIYADAAAPESVGWGWRRQDFFLGVVSVLHVVVVGIDLIVAGQAYGDGHDGLETLWCGEVGDSAAFDFAGWVEDEHAESNEGVAEEDCDAEEEQNEDDVDFLADVLFGKGDGEICLIVSLTREQKALD